MRQTMKGFGFSESDGFSPFSCHFATSDITELRDKLLKYLTSTFKYYVVKGVQGSSTHHSDFKGEDDAGSRFKSNNGCKIISYLEV